MFIGIKFQGINYSFTKLSTEEQVMFIFDAELGQTINTHINLSKLVSERLSSSAVVVCAIRDAERLSSSAVVVCAIRDTEKKALREIIMIK